MLRRSFSTAAAGARRVVFVDGVRTPFKLSGTEFKDYIAQDLGRIAIKGLLTKTALDPSQVDYTLYGTVIQEGQCPGLAGSRCRCRRAARLSSSSCCFAWRVGRASSGERAACSVAGARTPCGFSFLCGGRPFFRIPARRQTPAAWAARCDARPWSHRHPSLVA
jgi:hypothetical protein